MTKAHMKEMYLAYIECALWSSHDESSSDGGSLMNENYCYDDISQATQEEMYSDCLDFVTTNAKDLEQLDPVQVGHDFWLTRNSHGAGFWDRGLGELGKRLTDNCKPYGEVYLYVGDDGLVHQD